LFFWGSDQTSPFNYQCEEGQVYIVSFSLYLPNLFDLYFDL
jgi:hypothetical protein